MNIGVDLRTLINGNKSGIPGFTFELLKKILENDTQNKYFGFYNSYKNLEFPTFSNKIENIKLNVPNKILNPSLRFLNIPKLNKIIPCDVFYMPHFNFNAFSENSYKVITVHDLSFLRYPEFFSIKNNLWHKMIQVEKTLKSFDKIVAISNNTKNDIVELFNIPEKKIKVVYSGVDSKYRILDSSSKELFQTKNKYKLPDKYILSLGTIEPRKNIDSLIKSFDQFIERTGSDYFLIIAGGVGWKYKNVLKTYNKTKHKDRIKFLGFIDEEDKNAIYNLSSLFVFPSYYEGFGFPPLEALKTGTPVLSSANSSMLEILGDSAYFVDPYDICDISKGIENLLSSTELRDRLLIKSEQNLERFSWDKTSSEYLNIFNEK